jgi:hypothetical protein
MAVGYVIAQLKVINPENYKPIKNIRLQNSEGSNIIIKVI